MITCNTYIIFISSPEWGMWVRLSQDVPVAIFVEGMVHWVTMQLWGWHVPSGLLVASSGIRDLPFGSPTLP